MTRRILLEVTEFQESRRWFRHLSGVPRTVMEIGRRLLDEEELEVECFFYNAAADGFYYADRGLFGDERAREEMEAGGFARLGSAGGDFVDLLRRGAETAGRIGPTRRVYRWVRRRLALLRGAVPVTFRSDDTVLILGAMWGSRELPDAMVGAWRTHRFDVAALVYDLIPVDYPQFYNEGFPEQYEHYLDRVLEMSSRVFVISRATRRSLEKHCIDRGTSPPPTDVIHLGDGAVFSGQPVRPQGLPEGDFVLAVSTFEPRKNHEVLYRAVKHARLRGITLPRVVVVGSPGWLTHELQTVVATDPDTRDAFIWRSRTTDSELVWLYENALFTLYPSIAEGWGLPIAESMHFGKFCITSDASSMPEVAGDLADYLSPYDPAAWAERIAHYATDRTSLAEREARIRSEYAPRSWDDAAADIRRRLRG